MRKKFISALIILAMLLTLLPATATAAPGLQFYFFEDADTVIPVSTTPTVPRPDSVVAGEWLGFGFVLEEIATLNQGHLQRFHVSVAGPGNFQIECYVRPPFSGAVEAWFDLDPVFQIGSFNPDFPDSAGPGGFLTEGFYDHALRFRAAVPGNYTITLALVNTATIGVEHPADLKTLGTWSFPIEVVQPELEFVFFEDVTPPTSATPTIPQRAVAVDEWLGIGFEFPGIAGLDTNWQRFAVSVSGPSTNFELECFIPTGFCCCEDTWMDLRQYYQIGDFVFPGPATPGQWMTEGFYHHPMRFKADVPGTYTITLTLYNTHLHVNAGPSVQPIASWSIPIVVSPPEIPNVAVTLVAPVAGAEPADYDELSASAGFGVTNITWPAAPVTFGPSTVYNAIVTLTVHPGFEMTTAFIDNIANNLSVSPGTIVANSIAFVDAGGGGAGSTITFEVSFPATAGPGTGGGTVVNRRPLELKVEAAEVRVQANYTPESWAVLQAAIANAEEVLGRRNVTQAQLNAALNVLRDAYAGLVRVGDNGYQPPPPPPPPWFYDVSSDAWFYDYIRFMAYYNDFMRGLPGNLFDPDGTLTRGMVAVVLHRIEEEPAVAFSPVFDDVVGGHWYSDAIVWAAQYDLVRGFGDGSFRPHEEITREQLAALLYRYAGFLEEEVAFGADFDLGAFADAGEVSPWAENYKLWAVYNELIGGRTPTTLVPMGLSTRAECAALFMRFLTDFLGE